MGLVGKADPVNQLAEALRNTDHNSWDKIIEGAELGENADRVKYAIQGMQQHLNSIKEAERQFVKEQMISELADKLRLSMRATRSHVADFTKDLDIADICAEVETKIMSHPAVKSAGKADELSAIARRHFVERLEALENQLNALI